MTDYARCPRCNSPVYDNRPDKALGLHPKRPDLKCSAPACNWAVWDDGKQTANRMAVVNSPPTPDGPERCRCCGELFDWQPIWVWRPGPKGEPAEYRVGERLLVRHAEGRPCERFNVAHRWADGPKPEREAPRPVSPVDDIKQRWREALRRIEQDTKGRAA